MDEENLYSGIGGPDGSASGPDDGGAPEAFRSESQRPLDRAVPQENAFRQGIYEESEPVRQGEYRSPDGFGNDGRQGNASGGPVPGGSARADFDAGGQPSGTYGGQEYFAGGQASGVSLQQEAGQPPGRGFGIASLTLGIVSLVLFCSCVNVVLAAVAIVFGILQLVQKDAPKGMAIAGIALSCFSIILFFVALVAFLYSAAFEDAQDPGSGVDRALEDYLFRDGEAPRFDEDGDMYFPDFGDDYDYDDDDAYDAYDDYDTF